MSPEIMEAIAAQPFLMGLVIGQATAIWAGLIVHRTMRRLAQREPRDRDSHLQQGTSRAALDETSPGGED
jgi:hypothetical protein